MPLHYSQPREIEPARTADDIYVTEVHIRLPRNGPATVTYIYEAVDSNGNSKGHRPLTETVDAIRAEDPVHLGTAYRIIENRAYAKAQAAGFPAGGTVV